MATTRLYGKLRLPICSTLRREGNPEALVFVCGARGWTSWPQVSFATVHHQSRLSDLSVLKTLRRRGAGSVRSVGPRRSIRLTCSWSYAAFLICQQLVPW